MISGDIPGFIVLPFADSGGKTTIPVTTAAPGRASLTEGFPALTRTPIASGGIPPDGTDMNGILFEVSAWSRWSGVGGPVVWDSALSTAVGGYPRWSLLTSAALNGMWFSLVNNNTNDPDTTGTNWTNAFPVSTTISATATLNLRQKGIVLVDATAGNITLTLPGGTAALSTPIQYDFIRTDATANTVTIVRAGANTIEGLTSITLGVGQRIVLNSAGTSTWRVVSTTAGSGMQAFTSSGTFTVPSGVFRVKVICTGGGAAGGGATLNGGGGGGSAGQTAVGWYDVTPGASVSVTIGAGGIGVVASAGGNGGTSSFGAFCSSPGGVAGQAATGIGGVSASAATGGQLNLWGGDGGDGSSVIATGDFGGVGGASFWGGGGRDGTTTGGGGFDGRAYGSGGGGAYDISGGTGAGGNGAPGVVVVEWN